MRVGGRGRAGRRGRLVTPLAVAGSMAALAAVPIGAAGAAQAPVRELRPATALRAEPARASRVRQAPVADLTRQTIAWTRCLDRDEVPGLPPSFYRMLCGHLTAPADWAAPDPDDTVRIAVSRLPAARPPALGATFTNPGGPGGPGVELPLLFSLANRRALLRTQDVYGMDVRGTGLSTNLTCGGPAMQTLLDPRDRSERNTSLLLANAELVARFCAAAPGLPAARVTTADTVRDVELLRAVVGAERFNWLGYSAGTWLGVQYANAFPRRAGRFVLDSAVDVTGTWQDAFQLQPVGFERRFREDFAPWAARYHREYGLGRTAAEVVVRYEAIRSRLTPQAPVESAALMDQSVAGALYAAVEFPYLAATLTDLEDYLDAERLGDATRARRASARVTARPRPAAAARGFVRPPLSSDAAEATFVAVTCNDTAWSGGAEGILASSAELGRKYPLMGPGTISEPCAFWPDTHRRVGPPTARGLPPMLVVNSAHDPATPIEGARRTAAALPGSRLLTVKGEGDHGMYAGGNACVDRAVERFLLRGTLPAAGASCPGRALPLPETYGAARTDAVAPGPLAAPGNPLVELSRLRERLRPVLTR